MRSWLDSLTLFLPSKFKLFSLATLKGIVSAYRILFLYFWPLLLATALADYVFAQFFSGHIFLSIVPLLLWLLFFFVVYLTVRPSIKLKNYNYYRDYPKYFLYFILFSILAQSISGIFILATEKVACSLCAIHPLLYTALMPLFIIPVLILFLMPPSCIIIYLSPLLTFAILFMLDSDGSLKEVMKSLLRALKMVWYNFPFCLITLAIFLAIAIGASDLIGIYLGYNSILLTPIFTSLLLVIPLYFYTNFYKKRIHDQFSLYYPDSSKE